MRVVFFFFFFFFIYIYKADLSIIHCLNIVRCIIVYLKYIIVIMKFQKKKLLLLKIFKVAHSAMTVFKRPSVYLLVYNT